MQLDSALDFDLEPFFLDRQVVLSRRKLCKGVKAFRAAHRRTRGANVIVDDGDFCGSHGCTCGIHDRALNGPIVLHILRESCRRENQHQTAKQHPKPRPSHKSSWETPITDFVRLD